MINKLKENKYIKIINELLQNKRTRAATKLVLWLIFFAFVFSVMDNGGNNSVKPTYDSYEQWKNRKNYDYQMTFNVNKDEYVVSGSRYNQKEIFYIANKQYYIENDYLYLYHNDQRIFQNDTKILDFDILKLRPNFLSTLIPYAKLEYTTTYENGMTKKGYSILTEKFSELYNNLVITDDSTVTMEVVEQDKEILEVNLDLKNYQKYSINDIENYKIRIVYSNINKVSDFILE